jgi:hypothetical protein
MDATAGSPSPAKLVGYLEEALSSEEMAWVEEQLRRSEAWRLALAAICEQRDFGDHTVATIWRRHRLTCPSRERLGAFHLGAMGPDEAEYVRFHLEVLGCRFCVANLQDLASAASALPSVPSEAGQRRRRFFQTSVGRLPDPKR